MGLTETTPLDSLEVSNKQKDLLNSMSQDFHQGIFSFSNGYERSQQVQQQQHIVQQIRRDNNNNKLRVQGFEPPLVGMEEEEDPAGSLPVYESAGVLSEMFNFPSGGGDTATELLESQIVNSYRNPRAAGPTANWFSHRQGVVVGGGGGLGYSKNQGVNTDSAEAMQLFPNPGSSSSAAFHGGAAAALGTQFPWGVPNGGGNGNYNPNEGQGLALSLSSSLQQMEEAKAEEMRIGGGGMVFYGSGSGGNQFGAAANTLRSSNYVRAAQELLEEFCSVGRGHLKKNKLGRQNNTNPSGGGAGVGNSSSSSKDFPPLSASDRLEHQRRKVKLLAMLDEVDRRYNHYCEQMQMVVNSFDMVMGFGAAVPYTSLAQKAMSRHFRCLKEAIAAQLKHSCEMLGEKDAITSGVTKGETPRLRMLEQSLRQQRAFHQMGIMEQEAWRPQRGLPEKSVNILRAWLFEHFLHPYPSDADKHLLARQTGLSRNQVSNWFINARVRLWKPMVEEMYQKEAKEEITEQGDQCTSPTQTPTPTTTAAAPAAFTPPPKRPEIINAPENDTSFVPINNTHCFSENQAELPHHPDNAVSGSAQAFPAGAMHEADTCRGGTGDIESALIRFGTSAGDVSLTLGLRHAGNMAPVKSAFSVRDFGGC